MTLKDMHRLRPLRRPSPQRYPSPHALHPRVHEHTCLPVPAHVLQSCPGRSSLGLTPNMVSIVRICICTVVSGIPPHPGTSGPGTAQSECAKGRWAGAPVVLPTKSMQYSTPVREPGKMRREYVDSGRGRMRLSTDVSPGGGFSTFGSRKHDGDPPR